MRAARTQAHVAAVMRPALAMMWTAAEAEARWTVRRKERDRRRSSRASLRRRWDSTAQRFQRRRSQGARSSSACSGGGESSRCAYRGAGIGVTGIAASAGQRANAAMGANRGHPQLLPRGRTGRAFRPRGDTTTPVAISATVQVIRLVLVVSHGSPALEHHYARSSWCAEDGL